MQNNVPVPTQKLEAVSQKEKEEKNGFTEIVTSIGDIRRLAKRTQSQHQPSAVGSIFYRTENTLNMQPIRKRLALLYWLMSLSVSSISLFDFLSVPLSPICAHGCMCVLFSVFHSIDDFNHENALRVIVCILLQTHSLICCMRCV